jgi:hypothetical protein
VDRAAHSPATAQLHDVHRAEHRDEQLPDRRQHRIGSHSGGVRHDRGGTGARHRDADCAAPAGRQRGTKNDGTGRGRRRFLAPAAGGHSARSVVLLK